MQTKIVFAVVLGTAAAGLGAAMMLGGKPAPEPVQPASAAPSPVPTSAAAVPASSNAEWNADPMAGLDRAASDGGQRGTDWEARLEQFDWGAVQQMSREERRELMRKMREEWEAEADKNGDGEVDEDERLDAVLASGRGQRLLDQFDADGDGMLDPSERQTMREEQARREQERQQRMLERYDTDGDGELSAAEQQARRDEQNRQRREQMQRMSEEFDRDGDGDLNADERTDAWQTMRERREIDAFIGRYDSNGDGQITSVDFNAFLVIYQAGDTRADVNRDNAVNTLDVNAFRDMMARAGNRP